MAQVMTAPEWTLVGVFVATVVLIFGTRLRADLVALMAALALALLGVIPEGTALQGLSSTVVLTLFGLFILAEGLEDTGLIRAAAARIASLGGGSERRVLLTLMGSAGTLSLIMNNVAVGALYLPAAARVGRSSGIPASKLLLPVAYATLLGGMATIFTGANIIMIDLLLQGGSEPLGMLDFARTGGLVAVGGIAYLLLVGPRLLGDRSDPDDEGRSGDFLGLYRLGERFTEFEVDDASALAGRTIEEIGFRSRHGVSVLAVRRRRRTFLVPGPGIALMGGDRVVVLGREERVRELVGGDTPLRIITDLGALGYGLELTEVVVPPRSSAVGRTLAELELRSRYGVTVLALWRGGRVIRTDVGSIPLAIGDALLVVNVPKRLEALTRGADFVGVGGRFAAPSRPERAPLALGIFALVVVLALSGAVPIGEVVLGGALLMVLTGCVGMEQAYRAVEWHVIFLVAGLLPLGFAMMDTGLADRVAGLLSGVTAGAGPMAAIALMFGVSVATTQVIGGQVAAVLVGPVALSVAAAGGTDVRAMALAVALGASTAFLTPMAHPVNALMVGQGGYRPADFARLGSGLVVVTLVLLVVALRWLWGVPLTG